MAIVDDYAEIGKRYRALTDRWIPSQTERKYPVLFNGYNIVEQNRETPTFDLATGEVMRGPVSVSADVRGIIERIKANRPRPSDEPIYREPDPGEVRRIVERIKSRGK